MTVSPDTLHFLRALADNNHREWFAANKKQYEAALENMKKLTQAVEKALGESDLLESAKLFRIYRDVRFSADKSPYKTHFGIHFSRATKKLRGGYYLHIEPGGSFAGGGFWQPNTPDLKRIREEFAADATTIRQIEAEARFKKYFGSLKAMDGDELKTAPQGYDKNHPAIDLLRKKSFIVRRDFTDAEVLAPGFVQEVNLTFEAMRPFFNYMSDVLTTDANGVSLVD